MIAVSCLALLGFAIEHVVAGKAFWDLDLYQRAVELARSAGDPYAMDGAALRWVYPPLTLKAFLLLGPTLKPLFAAGYLAIVSVFLYRAPPVLALSFLVSFGVFALTEKPLGTALVTGNITGFLHLGIVLLWTLQVRTPVQLAVIFLATLIKPSFATYFALFVLHVRFSSTTALLAVSTGFLALFATVAQMWVWPEDFSGFLSALKEQVDLGGQRQDIGFGPFLFAFNIFRNTSAALTFHAAVWGASVLAWLTARRWLLAQLPSDMKQVVMLAIPLILCVLATPRLKVYDAAIVDLLAVWLLLSHVRIRQETWPVWVTAAGVHFLALTRDTPIFGLNGSVPVQALQTAFLLTVMVATIRCSAKRGVSPTRNGN